MNDRAGRLNPAERETEMFEMKTTVNNDTFEVKRTGRDYDFVEFINEFFRSEIELCVNLS